MRDFPDVPMRAERKDPDDGLKANAILADGPGAGTMLRTDEQYVHVATPDGVAIYKATKDREPDGLRRYTFARLAEPDSRTADDSARVVGDTQRGGSSGTR